MAGGYLWAPRPYAAQRSAEAEACLARGEGAQAAGEAAAAQLRFGSNLRGSEEYRRRMAEVLVRRAARQLEEEQG